MKIKSLSAALLLSITTTIASAGSWVLDQSHTYIGFAINHMGYSITHGYFKDYEGTVEYDKQKPGVTTLNFSIKTKSVTSVSTDLDEHLRNADFFDVEKYPTMTFKSQKITAQETAGKFELIGDLTLLGKTKPVTLEVTLMKHEVSPLTKLDTLGFSATTTIKRSEWGMDYIVPNVSDTVEITIDGELNLKE